MTFEEFLIKKKIDPAQLQHADQDFFDEFKSHFNQMGEKSFDHSKKFWFNKLRRAHPLVEKRTEVLEVPSENHKQPAEALEKRTEALEKRTEALEVSSIKAETPSSTENQAKPAFKPRFKANITIKEDLKNIEEKAPENNESEAAKPAETIKTAYKPRFKAPSKPLDETQGNKGEIDTQKEIIESKSAYKPRFKAGVVKKDPKSE